MNTRLEHSLQSEPAPEPRAWHSAYPSPHNKSPGNISRTELLRRLEAGEVPGLNFLLIDLRRDDHKGGTIRGSLNLPAQSLYASLPTIYALCLASEITTVIWYCGSSKGRGARAAGWFDDLAKSKGNLQIQSLTLLDGIQGWARAGQRYQAQMDEYEAAVWEE